LDGVKRLAREASASCLSFTSVTCKRIVADFRFIDEFERNIAEPYNRTSHGTERNNYNYNNDSNGDGDGDDSVENTGGSFVDYAKQSEHRGRAGTLLKMLLTQLDYSDRQANQVSLVVNLVRSI
jgi:hypothetical protein